MGYGEFYRVQKIPPVYAEHRVMEYCSTVFHFLIREKHEIPVYTAFTLYGIEFTLVEVTHPPIYTCGVVISDGIHRIGYTSDTNECLPENTTRFLTGLDLLLIDGLFPASVKKVEKHLNYEEAITMAAELKATDFRIVHMSHYLPFNLPYQGHDGERFVF
jgi:phosphoribosyl 1,2-cyclic phosphate phosphodiesterase